MPWYSAEIQAYPRFDLGATANPSMPDRVVRLQTNQREYVRLVTEMVGSQYCDLNESSSSQVLTLYVTAPRWQPLVEVRLSIHRLLRTHLPGAPQRPSMSFD